MPTAKQLLGEWGERLVASTCAGPKCKRTRSLKRLPANFKCADVICDFCGYLAQVKTATVKQVDVLPKRVTGAAWKPQQARMRGGIYFPLFLVLRAGRKKAVYYLSADLQTQNLFSARRPLSKDARRAGWRGFYYDLSAVLRGSIVRVSPH